MNHLLDVSNILHRGLYGIGGEYGCILFLLNLMERIVRSDGAAQIHLCLDGKPIKSKALCKEYKANREHTVSAYTNLPSLLGYLKEFPRVKVYYNSTVEADDLIFTLARDLPCAIIHSADNDLFQCIDDDTVVDTGTGVVTHENLYTTEKYVKKFCLVEPRKLALYRAIVGDASDNLKPPVARFPHILAAKLVHRIDGEELPEQLWWQEIAASPDLSEKERVWVGRLHTEYNNLHVNFHIMKLRVCEKLDEDYPQGVLLGNKRVVDSLIQLKNLLEGKYGLQAD